MRINKGDIVGRLSYNKDILFVVDRIIHNVNGNDIAILKGVSIRIEADSPINDLVKIDSKLVKEIEKNIDNNINEQILKFLNNTRSVKREQSYWHNFTFRW